MSCDQPSPPTQPLCHVTNLPAHTASFVSCDQPSPPTQAQDYPVDESDLQSFIIRAGTAVQPLVDLLYQKAFTTYDSIFEISVSNFDKKFRVQNAQRLLK